MIFSEKEIKELLQKKLKECAHQVEYHKKQFDNYLAGQVVQPTGRLDELWIEIKLLKKILGGKEDGTN